MTKINKLVLHGFKSFGEKTELVFGDGFNCILGPNGSGKSNIFDAICFVLGKGSAKGLRAEKSANLIYNGGKNRQPAKFGEVSIYFDNSDGTFPTEEKEVKITRIVKPSGQSVYKINDKTRTREEILELLGIAKINSDGYNIVLQGDIVRFIEMSNTEKRLIIEDIAGISLYEEKKQKALQELQKVDEKLNEVEIVLNERKQYLDQLKEEHKQALRFKELEGKLKQNKVTLLYRQLQGKQKEQQNIEEKQQAIKEKMTKRQEKIKTLKEQIEEHKQRIAAINQEIEQKGDQEQVALHKVVENLRVNIATKLSKIENLEKEIEKIHAREEQLKKNAEELAEKERQLLAEIEALEKQRKEKEEKFKAIDLKIQSLKEKYNLSQASSLEEEIEAIDTVIEQEQQTIETIRMKQQELLREKDKLEMQLSTLDDKIAKLKEIEKQHKAEMEKLKAKRQEFKKTTLELNKALNDDSSAAAQLKNARQKLIELQDKIAALKAKNAALNERRAQDIAIQKIMEQKEQFGLVYGPLYELGQVNAKYSLALEIAAGPRIKSIVVEDDQTAAACIKFLKKNKLGVATFLPLNKIKPPEQKDVKPFLKAEGVIGKALDLISFDKKFKKAFAYAFGDTLVVKDIDVARRIGIGNIRMVTLTGDLIEMSGAMHGGFRQQRRSIGFKEKEAVEELEEYEQQLADYQAIVQKLEQKREELDETIERLRNYKAELEAEIITMEKSLHLEPEEIDLNEKLKEELQEKLAAVDKELMAVQMEISQKNQELAKQKIKRQELKNQIAQLRDPAKLAELNTFEQQKQQTQEQLQELLQKIHSYEVQLESVIKKEMEDIEKILMQNEKEEKTFKREIHQLQKEIKEDQKTLKEKEKQEKEFYEQYKTLFKQRNELADKVQALEIEVIAKEEELRRYEQQLNNLELQMTKIKTEAHMLEQEYQQYEGIALSDKPDHVLKREITEFEKMIAELGSVNLKAIELYHDLENEYNSLIKKKEKLHEEREDVLVMMNEIDTKKKDAFMKTFTVINDYFKKMFQQLSYKGEAYLELENEEDPFAAGMTVKVKISSKKFLDLRSLSGGEKTLTALAFIFAIQEYEPASFYVFDEVDAALDKRNAEKLGKLIKEYAKKAQYIIVSHNDGVIAEADYLFGVSMREDGISKVVSLKI